MCQAKKDGGLRCAAHLKEAMVKVQKEETTYFATKQKEFLLNNPDIANDPKVKESIERRIQAVKDSPEFKNFKVATFNDVEKAHKIALDAKELRDKEKSAGYELSLSFQSISKAFKSFKKKEEVDVKDTPQNYFSSYGSGKISENPEGATKAYYFYHAADEEQTLASERFKDNPSEQNKIRLDQSRAIFSKAQSNYVSYRFNSNALTDVRNIAKRMRDNDPGISVYQYNYDYEVENFRKTKDDYKSSADKSNEHAQKFQEAVEQAKVGAITDVGPYTKEAKRFRDEVYSKDPQAIARGAELASLKDDYQLTRSYRNKLKENVEIYKREGKTKEAQATQMKLELLTEKYDERKNRKASVDSHMAVKV